MEISPNSIGIFYPRFENELLKLFKRFSRKKINYNSRLVVVPHAGYEFSGRVAFNTYQYLDKTVKNVIVIAPALYKNISGTVSCDAKSFKTPCAVDFRRLADILGNILYPRDIHDHRIPEVCPDRHDDHKKHTQSFFAQ